jgi:hypothetical protein
MTICETSKAHDNYDDRPPQAAHEDDSSLLSHQGNASTTMSSSGGPSASHVFTFDHVYDQASTQNKVREHTTALLDAGEGVDVKDIEGRWHTNPSQMSGFETWCLNNVKEIERDVAVLRCDVGVRDDGAWGGGECTRGLQCHHPRLWTGQTYVCTDTVALLPCTIPRSIHAFIYFAHYFRVAGSVDSRARADVDVCGCGVADGHGQDLHHGGIQ